MCVQHIYTRLVVVDYKFIDTRKIKRDDGHHDNIHNYTQYTQIYTNIYKYTQFYVHVHEILVCKNNSNNSQYDRYINTTCLVRQLEPTDSSSSRWNIAAPNANENTARNSNTQILCTVNDKSDKHEPQLREFIELCPYANVCTPSSRM